MRSSLFQVALVATLFLATGASAVTPEEPRAHWERVAIEGGSELLTLFSMLPGDAPESEPEEVPILSVLRDTLGDENPDNDRLRYVWLLVDQKQRALVRWITPEPDFGDMPRPLVDLASPDKGVWKTVFRRIVQEALLDRSGAGIRISSRTHLSGQRASRTVRLFEALTILQRLRDDVQQGPLDRQEYSQVFARVLLAERAFGGLVRDEGLDQILERQLGARRQWLGTNWELLRQRAEAEGLVFQPIGVADEPPAAALLWVSRADLDERRPRAFSSKFLGIANPWRDPGLHQWRGYTERWCFDSKGCRTSDEAAAADCDELIPLALYGLDHPKAPFLIVDFRSPWRPTLRETARLTMEEVPRTFLGLTAFAHIELRGAQFALDSIRSRRGAPVRRPPRLRATAAVRQIIASAPQLAPEMREDLTKRLGAAEASSSRRYESLLAWARSPDGLPRRIEKDRGQELARLLHPKRTRGLNVLTAATVGLYRYRIATSTGRIALLDRERRLATAARAVEAAFAASPRLDVGTDVHRVWAAAHTLVTVPSVNPAMRKRSERLLGRLAEQPFEGEIRQKFIVLFDAREQVAMQSATFESGGLD